MRKPRIGATAASVIFACVMLSACGDGGGNAEFSPDADEVGNAGTSAVFVQMTGLLLIVPPTSAGGAVQVYLPKPRNGGAHPALLGFVIPHDMTLPSGFCQKVNGQVDPSEICYVDLTVWTLRPFGNGGRPTTSTGISPVGVSGLLNVTRLSGGNYKAFPPRVHDRSHPRITLLSGQLVDNLACKLAEWRYQPVNQAGLPQGSLQTARLSNVVVWGMTNLVRPELVFSKRGSSDVRVPLPPGETRMILAHIPRNELRHLPPAGATKVTRSTHADFHPFYDLLGRSSSARDSLPHVSQHRRIPSLVNGGTVPCGIVLGTGARQKDEVRSMATYACMPAWGGS